MLSKYRSLKKWQRFLIESLVVIILFLCIRAFQMSGLLKEGEVLPPLKLRSLDGEMYEISAGHNGPTLIYAFAPWCGVCALHASSLNEIQETAAKRNTRVYAIALAYESVQDVREFVENHNLSPVVLLGDAKTNNALSIEGFPTYYVVDSDLRVIARNMGYTPTFRLKWQLWGLF